MAFLSGKIFQETNLKDPLVNALESKQVDQDKNVKDFIKISYLHLIEKRYVSQIYQLQQLT